MVILTKKINISGLFITHYVGYQKPASIDPDHTCGAALVRWPRLPNRLSGGTRLMFECLSVYAPLGTEL